MGIFQSLLGKLGLEDYVSARQPLHIFLLDDDVLRHEWFAKKFKSDELDVAADAERAIEMLSRKQYHVVFLDHDLLPEHYNSDTRDDARTGYAVAHWLSTRPDRQSASHIIVHTRNADGAFRMVELLRRAGRQAEHVPFHQLAPKLKAYWRR